MDSPNNNKDVLGSDTEATSGVVESTPPEFVDLTEEELEDQMIAVDDYNAIYTRSLAIRDMFPSLNDDTCWTGKWKLKPGNYPNMKEVKEISRYELYTDEEIDFDNWNAGINLALGKIAVMQQCLRKLEDSLQTHKTPVKRPYCVFGKILAHNKFECTRCGHVSEGSLITGIPYPAICYPPRKKRFHPYSK